MDAFLKTLQTLPEVAELVSRVENGGCPAVLTGTQPVQRACIGAAVADWVEAAPWCFSAPMSGRPSSWQAT